MKNLKLFTKIMLVMILTIFFTSCIPRFTDPTEPTEESSGVGGGGSGVGGGGGVSIKVETDAAIQEGYRKQWIENTKGITKGAYTGEPDLWGGGSFGEIEMWFNNEKGEESKYLWYHSYLFPAPEIAYRLVSEKGKPAFVDGETAILYVTATTSDLMRYTIFIFRVKDGKIYRTKSAWGFGGVQGGTKVDNWDLTIPKEEFDKLVVVNESRYPPTPGDIILNPGKQAEYKEQWLENTKHITGFNYEGHANIIGVANDYKFEFRDGNLWGSVPGWYDPDTWEEYVYYNLLTDSGNTTANKTTFIDGKTAVMFTPLEGLVEGSLYIVKVENDKIYRTGTAKGGFTKMDTWDGKRIPKKALDNLVEIGKKVK